MPHPNACPQAKIIPTFPSGFPKVYAKSFSTLLEHHPTSNILLPTLIHFEFAKLFL